MVEEDAEAMQQELKEAFRLYDKEGIFLCIFKLKKITKLRIRKLKHIYRFYNNSSPVQFETKECQNSNETNKSKSIVSNLTIINNA